MSLWYDIKKKSYASDGKGSWLKSYVDKVFSDFKTKFNTLLESHYIGDEGRHSAEDVICNNGKSVETALLNESAERLSSIATIRQEMELKNGELSETISKETSDRTSADGQLEAKINAEETSRISADNILQINIDAETQNRQAALDLKVDKVSGKGLSANDFTDTEKNKLSLIEEGAEKNMVNSVSGKIGVVKLTKEDVGLSNVDNTSDSDKPVSAAVQAALDDKAEMSYVDNALSDKANVSDVITKTNTTAFTPTNNYQPATKKYVDDSVSAAGGGDMLKSVYDQNGDGIVDNAEKLGGQSSSYYATKSDLDIYATKTELDAKAPKSHASTSTTYGAGSTTDYGHVKLANNLTTTSTTGYALAANQGKILNEKITALATEINTPPALTDVTPDGTKIGNAAWTGTGWVCTAQNTKYAVKDTPSADIKNFNRFCLKPANNSFDWRSWTPFFEYNDVKYEFFYSVSRGLYEALIPSNTMTAAEVVSEIVWENIAPSELRYGKVSNALGYREITTTNTDGSTSKSEKYFVKRESDFKYPYGDLTETDANVQFGLYMGKYTIESGKIDVNNLAFLVLSYDLEVTGSVSITNVSSVNKVVAGTTSDFIADNIDNFS